MNALTRIKATVGQAMTGWNYNDFPVLKDDGEIAIFKGRRYTRTDSFELIIKITSLGWEHTFRKDKDNEAVRALTGLGAMDRDHYCMGAFSRAPITQALVFFTDHSIVKDWAFDRAEAIRRPDEYAHILAHDIADEMWAAGQPCKATCEYGAELPPWKYGNLSSSYKYDPAKPTLRFVVALPRTTFNELMEVGRFADLMSVYARLKNVYRPANRRRHLTGYLLRPSVEQNRGSFYVSTYGYVSSITVGGSWRARSR
jgi:hypothetical protein